MGIVGNCVLISCNIHAVQEILHFFSRLADGRQVHQHQVIVRASGHYRNSPADQALAKRFRIQHNIFSIFLELRTQYLLEADRFGSDHMHQRSPLDSREYRLIQLVFLRKFLTGQDQAASWTSQRLMRGSRSHMRIGNWAGMLPGSHKPRNMGNIHHQIRAHLIRYLTEPLEINRSGIRAGACHNHLRPAFPGGALHLIVINEAFRINPIGYAFKIGAGEICRASVRQMATLRKVHAHHGIPWLKQGKKYCHICLRAGMRLHVSIGTSKNLLGTRYGKSLHFIYALAASIKPFSRISLCIFIGKGASHSCHNRFRNPVF